MPNAPSPPPLSTITSDGNELFSVANSAQGTHIDLLTWSGEVEAAPLFDPFIIDLGGLADLHTEHSVASPPSNDDTMPELVDDDDDTMPELVDINNDEPVWSQHEPGEFNFINVTFLTAAVSEIFSRADCVNKISYIDWNDAIQNALHTQNRSWIDTVD